jgi:ABC-type branched-subunit amino acid transport system substrate-binding protein
MDQLKRRITPRGGSQGRIPGVAVGLLVGSMVTALVLGPGGPSASQGVAAGAGGEGPLGAGGLASSPVGVASAPGITRAGAGPQGGNTSPGAVVGPGSTVAAGASGTANGSVQPGAASDLCGTVNTPGTRGVTDKVIKIGVGIPDVEAFGSLSPDLVIGDQQADFEAHLAALRKKGLLPVCGRDIKAVYRKYNVLEPSLSRSVCQGFIDTDQVFSVITDFSFGDPNCITQENKTLLVDYGNLLVKANLDASGGRLFSLSPPLDQALRIWATYVAKKVAPTHKKVGLYYYDPGDGDTTIQTSVIDVLKSNGYPPVIATTSNSPTTPNDPNDSVAVQRFKAAGVDVVLRIYTNFVDEAKRQGYRPQYVMYGSDVTKAKSGKYDPAYMDGSLGVHWFLENDIGNGKPPTPREQECIKDLTDAGIKKPGRDQLEWLSSNQYCDLLWITLQGIRAAGRNVTTNRVVLGIRTVKNYAAASMSPLSFSAEKQWGANLKRIARYDKDCPCWRNITGFLPLYE